MRPMRLIHRHLLAALVITLVMMLAGEAPAMAQGAFATNTPAPSGPVAPQTTPVPGNPFATVTPIPQPTATINPGPAADVFNYALRLWLEDDLLRIVQRQIDALNTGGLDARRALQLSLYELQTRFPGAPSNPESRIALISRILAAPRGSFDLRDLVRPLIVQEMNRRPDQINFETSGFQVTLTLTNFDGQGDLDALVTIIYPAGSERTAELLYEDYMVALADNGGWRMPGGTFDLPAAPADPIRSVELLSLADVNRDGLSEVALLIDDGQVNRRLLIAGIRSGDLVDLVLPEQTIRLGSPLSWPFTDPEVADPVLSVINFRQEQANDGWPCLSEIVIDWTYESNYYRPSTALNARYVRQDSLACALLDAEPIFSQEPSDAIATVEEALSIYGTDAPAADRAQMTLAMLYTIAGQPDRALATVQGIRPISESDAWVESQAQALVQSLGVSSNTALDVCEALVLASDNPACDMSDVLGRLLNLVDLSTESDLVAQLEALGFPVIEQFRVESLGRAPRIVVRFDLANSGWWGFAAGRDGRYLVETASAPVEATSTPEIIERISTPPSAYTALLVDNSPSRVLTILESQRERNPGLQLAQDGRYLEALAFDLSGRREEARQAYYSLWREFPTSVWGQLASEHLERR